MSSPASEVTVAEARERLLTTLLVLPAIAGAPQGRWSALGAATLVIAVLAWRWEAGMRAVAIRALAAFPFLLMFAVIPFFPEGPSDPVLGRVGPLAIYRQALDHAVYLLARVTCCVGLLAVLSSTTPFARTLEALRDLRAPTAFVTALGQTERSWRYLVEESRRMNRAMVSRGFRPRNLGQFRSIGRLVGSLVVRAHERSERVYAAMLNRGFTGQWPPRPIPAWTVARIARPVAAGVLVAAFWWYP